MAFIRYAHGYFNTEQVVKVEHETETTLRYTVFMSDGERIQLDGDGAEDFREFLAGGLFRRGK